MTATWQRKIYKDELNYTRFHGSVEICAPALGNSKISYFSLEVQSRWRRGKARQTNLVDMFQNSLKKKKDEKLKWAISAFLK